jgi:hypothetical protein
LRSIKTIGDSCTNRSQLLTFLISSFNGF